MLASLRPWIQGVAPPDVTTGLFGLIGLMCVFWRDVFSSRIRVKWTSEEIPVLRKELVGFFQISCGSHLYENKENKRQIFHVQQALSCTNKIQGLGTDKIETLIMIRVLCLVDLYIKYLCPVLFYDAHTLLIIEYTCTSIEFWYSNDMLMFWLHNVVSTRLCTTCLGQDPAGIGVPLPYCCVSKITWDCIIVWYLHSPYYWIVMNFEMK